MQKIFQLLTSIVILILLTGCFNLSEDIWINSDASGRVKADISISEKIVGFTESITSFSKKEDSPNQTQTFDLEKIKDILNADPNVKQVSVEEYNESGLRHYIIDAQVKDFHKIPELGQAISSDSGNNVDNLNKTQALITIEDSNRKKVRFKQFFRDTESNQPVEIKPEEEKTNKQGNAISKLFFNLVLGDQYITVNLHAKKIGKTNGRVSDDQKTVKWNIPLSKIALQDVLEADVTYR